MSRGAHAVRGISMQHLPTAGRWAVYVGLAVAFAVACAFLSQWQFARNEDREAQLRLVESNYDAMPVPVASVLPDTGFDPRTEWLPVILEGRYLVDEQVLVRNRPHRGTSAFEVLTPFRLDDGRVMVVNRGWVPPADDSSDPAAVPAPPVGPASVIVRLRPGEPLPGSGRGAPEGQVPTIHLPLIADRTGAETVTGAYGLMVDEEPATATRPAPLERPTEDPGPHLSYAIQWILFAIMGFIFIGYVIRSEVKLRREDAHDALSPSARDEIGERDEGDPSTRADRNTGRRRPDRGRRDRDADDEDAILDAARR